MTKEARITNRRISSWLIFVIWEFVIAFVIRHSSFVIELFAHARQLSPRLFFFPAVSEHFHRQRFRRKRARMRAVGFTETQWRRTEVRSSCDCRPSGCLGAQRAPAGSAQRAHLWSLRCAAAGPARALGIATIRAGAERGLRVCARRNG